MKSITILSLALLLSQLLITSQTGVSLDNNNYDEKVLQSGDVWLIEIFSPMCGTCKEFSPIWENIAKDLQSQFKIGGVNVDTKEGMQLAAKLGALDEGLPNLKIVYGKQGKQQTIMAGDIKKKDQLLEEINKVIKSFGLTQNEGTWQRQEL